jgi:predicted RND superfamily exporter protein
MTITISAIAIGIGVDDAIHYIHRFKAEFAQDHDYLATMYRPVPIIKTSKWCCIDIVRPNACVFRFSA